MGTSQQISSLTTPNDGSQEVHIKVKPKRITIHTVHNTMGLRFAPSEVGLCMSVNEFESQLFFKERSLY